MHEWGHRTLVSFNNIVAPPSFFKVNLGVLEKDEARLHQQLSNRTKSCVFFPAVMSDLFFRVFDGWQGAYCPLHLPNSHTHRHTPSHEQVRQYANTRGTCGLDAFTLQSLTSLTACQDVGCSFSQLCLHICFSGSNRVSVGMKGVGVVKKRTFIFCSCNMWRAQR